MSTIGPEAMLAWRNRFLRTETLSEAQYQEAWQDAEHRVQSGQINSIQWVELTRLANAALTRTDHKLEMPVQQAKTYRQANAPE